MSALVKQLRAILASAVAAVVLCAACAQAADPWGEVRARPQDMLGMLSCSAVSCHGGGGPRYWSGGAAGGEYVSWLGGSGTFGEGRRHYDPRARLEKADGDPHALAGQRIYELRFQEVLRRASLKADGSLNAGMYQRCAGCHDPGHEMRNAECGVRSAERKGNSGVEEIPAPPQTTQYEVLDTEYSSFRGIGCETCHGGAKPWMAVHYQRDMSRERLLELGMVDTKNLFVRARLCAGCHVGSPENDMNHDMIAAGHPPLRFEMASYEALIGRKHWDDRPRRAAEPDYEVQLWAAGRIAAAEAALAVLMGRAKRAGDQRSEVGGQRSDQGPWPEFAEGNCFACHQPLRAEIGRLTGPASSVGKTGMAVWQSWNAALVPELVVRRKAAEGELPLEAFGSAMGRLRGVMEASFEPRPDEVVSLAVAARSSLRAAVRIDEEGRVWGAGGAPVGAEAALKSLVVANAAGNWDEACHEVAALAAILRAMEDRGVSEIVSMKERLKRVARALRFGEADREWPVVFEAGPSKMTDVRSELDTIRSELMREVLDTIGGQP